MLQSGNQQHALAAQDARFSALGQDDGPPFQSGADAAPIDHRCTIRRRRDVGTRCVGSPLRTKLEHRWQTIESDPIHVTVRFRDPLRGPLQITAAPLATFRRRSATAPRRR